MAKKGSVLKSIDEILKHFKVSDRPVYMYMSGPSTWYGTCIRERILTQDIRAVYVLRTQIRSSANPEHSCFNILYTREKRINELRRFTEGIGYTDFYFEVL